MASGRDKPVTWYRRRAKARQVAALAATLTRVEAFTRQLQAELAEAARCHAIAEGIIADLAAEAGYDGAQG